MAPELTPDPKPNAPRGLLRLSHTHGEDLQPIAYKAETIRMTRRTPLAIPRFRNDNPRLVERGWKLLSLDTKLG